MNLFELETPCLVLEKGKLERNIQAMQSHIYKLGVKLRPHGKTAKSMNVIQLAMDQGATGITVSTLKEAEYCFENGITDILYAVGIAPVKLNHIASLIQRGANITIIVDNLEQVEFAIQKAQEHGVVYPILIEIDSDGHRAGVRPQDSLLLEVGEALHQAKGIEFRGVMTHAGGSYHSQTIEQIEVMAVTERDMINRCAQRLREAGFPCPIVSMGSTPTAKFSKDLTGITEIRSGVYMFYDLVMVGLGVCQIEDIALSVLTSVIGHQKEKGWIITDSGWTSLSSDRATAHQKEDQGYGLVCDVKGKPFSDLVVKSVNQEHGILTHRDPNQNLTLEDFPVGRLLRVLPNHSCATATMHDRFHVVDQSPEVLHQWSRIHGW